MIIKTLSSLLIPLFHPNKNPAERRTFGRGRLTIINVAKAKITVKSAAVDNDAIPILGGIGGFCRRRGKPVNSHEIISKNTMINFNVLRDPILFEF
jgi:hypothetical protein